MTAPFKWNETNCFIKKNVERHEYMIHKMIYNMKIVNMPNIYHYDKKQKIMYMQKIGNMCIADQYGESIDQVPEDILEKIRHMIEYLYQNSIIYPDITGYNFIKHNNKIWIIDFQHAKYSIKGQHMDDNVAFVEKFIDGAKEWNSNYI